MTTRGSNKCHLRLEHSSSLPHASISETQTRCSRQHHRRPVPMTTDGGRRHQQIKHDAINRLTQIIISPIFTITFVPIMSPKIKSKKQNKKQFHFYNSNNFLMSNTNDKKQSVPYFSAHKALVYKMLAI